MYHKRWFFLLVSLLLTAMLACNLPFGETTPELPTPTTETSNIPEESPAEQLPASPTNPPTEPSQPPTEAPTATIAPQSTNLCSHPYFPIELGMKWTYQSTRGVEVEQYSTEVIALDADSFTLHHIYDQFTNDVTWTCTENGIYTGGENLLNYSGMEFITQDIKVQGETLPKAELWDVGYQWQHSTIITGTFSEEGEQYPMMLSLQFDSRITGIEPVSVPAGDFPEAFRVESNIIANYQINVPDLTMPPMSFQIETTQWFVQDIGLVKMETTSDTGAEVTELLSYKTP